MTLFAHLVRRPEAELDLARAALLIAEPEYPDLDIPHYLQKLDELGAQARRRLAARDRTPGEAIATVAEILFWEAGFHGNESDYYDPRNSFLNEVVDRRLGIPITLAVILLEVCHRAGVAACGVSFPGHFLVRVDGMKGSLLVDPFTGGLLDRERLRALHARATGEEGDPDPRLLEPASKHQILLRMLHNLRGIYAGRSDRERLRGVLERIEVLAPSEELRRELDRLGGRSRGVPPWSTGGSGGPAVN
ncbi:MAG: hypothetical protein EXR72_11605 [Myxococcales bacterium]|nr:hypothetical protein [Myxococcales bacterium]